MKRFFAILTCLFVWTTFTAAAQTSAEDNRISPNFPSFKGVLLIQTHTAKAVIKILEKRFSKFYKGEFEIVEGDEINSGSYSNAKTYPFVVSFDHVQQIGNTDYYKFVMTDRTTGKKYETANSPDNTIPSYSIINSYAKALEKFRSK